MSTPQNDLIQELQANMATMRRLMAGHFQQAMHKPAISATQCELLFLISERDAVTLKELAVEMHVTPGAITQLVEGLEKAELVTRTMSAHDRRNVVVALTPNGHAKLAVFRRMHKDLFKELMATLSEDELRAMNTIHQKIIAYLKNPPAPPAVPATKWASVRKVLRRPTAQLAKTNYTPAKKGI